MATNRRDEELVFRTKAEGLGEIDKLAKEIEALAEGAGDAARPADDLLQSLRELGEQRAAIQTVERTGAALRQANTEFRNAQARVRELAEQIRQSDAPTKTLVREYERAQAQTSKLAAAQERARVAFREARNDVDRLGISTGNLAKTAQTVDAAFDRQTEALRRLRDETRSAAQRSQELRDAKANLAQTLRDSRAQLAAFGLSLAGLGTALTAASRRSREYSSALAEVSTLLDDTSGIEATSAAVRELAQEFGSDATEQARALYQIISAGAAEGAEATAVLTEANRLALAGMTEVSVAADGLTSVLNAYGLATEETARVSNAFFSAVRAGKTNVDELAGAIGRVAPIASTAGVEIEELLGTIAALTKGGVATNEAVTQLRAIIGSVIKPTADAAKAAQDLGVQFDLAALRSQGLAGFLDSIGQAAGGNDQVLSRLFGSVEGLGAVFALARDGAIDFRDTLDQVANSAGAVEQAVQRVQDTPQFAFNQLSAAAGELQTTLGDLANTVLVPLARALTEAIRGFNELPGVVQGAAVTITGSIAAYVLLAKTIGSIATGFRLVQAASNAGAGIAATGAAAKLATGPLVAFGSAISTLLSLKVAVPLAVGAAAVSLVRLGQVSSEVAQGQQDLLASTATLIERIEAVQAQYGQYANTVVKTREELSALSDAQLAAYIEALEGAQQLERANKAAQRSIARNADGAAEAARRVQEYTAAIQQAQQAQQALAAEQVRSTLEARRSLSDFARSAVEAFLSAQQAGTDAAAAIAEVFAGLDLATAEGINQLVEGVTAIGQASTASGDALQQAVITRVQQLSGSDLRELQRALSAALQSGAGEARALGAALGAIGDTIRQRLGIDLQEIATGISRTGAEALAAFDALSVELDRIGLAGEQRFEATARAVRATLRQLSTSGELAAFEERLQAAFAAGEISAEDYQSVLAEVRGETRSLGVATSETGATAQKAFNAAALAARNLRDGVSEASEETDKLRERTVRVAGELSEFLAETNQEFGDRFSEQLRLLADQASSTASAIDGVQAASVGGDYLAKVRELIETERERLRLQKEQTEEARRESEERQEILNQALAAGKSFAEAFALARQTRNEIEAAVETQQAAQRAPDRTFTVEFRVTGDVRIDQGGPQEVIDEIVRQVIDRIEADRRLTQ